MFFLLNMKFCVDLFDLFDLFQMLPFSLSATVWMSLLVTAGMKVQSMLLHFRVCCTFIYGVGEFSTGS